MSLPIRPGTPQDAPALHALIAANVAAGHLLPRTLDDLREHAPRFAVVTSRRRIVGCAELAPLSDEVAEIRSLVVDERHRGRRLGVRLVDELKRRAHRDGFATLCAFTHQPTHFIRLGFSIVPHQWVPEKIAHDCCGCPFFRRCGQYAMVFALEQAGREQPAAAQPALVLAGARA
jgi:amino-acid N-acetyltransferase